ncbi:MAG TPA: hypothetical protein VK519_04630, partial [Pinirhizobacter sp.]|uniref:hypothetical protein n=1 Tax=Pinirhizobacter sp. TaxID=2950432 RepID=UPI002BAB53E8
VVAERTMGPRGTGRTEGHRADLPVKMPLIVNKRVYVCGDCNTRWEPGTKAPGPAREPADFAPRP